ncbi:hypothetical protein [Phenylobacterium sp.]|uniref:hypothetical protein n=1 Tax=Phenylobacterium sp. TaxID=1871053 RepID=UPI0025CC3BCB|nr:hypothetical protein [Phenylobacterium sp.]MCA6289875.1 hypothetical protein [Phenylobacterium sp.]MCA6311652.1 hypothetical protein [Phenylobacterium sp.]MCA6324838.1 hypothetical protein [Phenylobacterium sp.]MCA6338461.1 hypothetical protein [Phenylobacterium sp.]MCA6341020.1 hypothetical protein [Phenylobacterium sp.]
MAEAASFPGRLEVFRTLREGLSLLPMAFVPSLLSDLVAKAVGPGASPLIALPVIGGALALLFLLSCLSILVAVIFYQDLRAQVAGTIPAEQPQTDGVPA